MSTITQQEYLRVVPIYNHKPKTILKELVTNKDDRELLDVAEAAPAGAQLVYKGGRLIQNVEIFTVFWGTNWSKKPTYVSLSQKINQFFKDIVTSALMDQLAEYNAGKYVIGKGSFIGTTTITQNAPVKSITDSQIQTALAGWITSGTVPPVTNNTLYFIYTDIHVKVLMGGSASCTSFCGYHNNFQQNTYYAVMPFPGCQGCLGGNSVFDAITGTSSHELCEAITDPVPGESWYDEANGEIGDICAWQFKKLDGYNVQLEWSNAKNACV